MIDNSKALAEIKTTRGLEMIEAMNEQSETIAILKKYITQNMVKDEDYGMIPGTKSDTLLLPGAEKIAALFRCTPTYTNTHRSEDFKTGLFTYEWACTFISIDNGKIVANGVGSANSYESKWRWRNVARKCPQCGKEAIIKGNPQYAPKNQQGFDEGGWLCWKRKDGCGAQFPDKSPAIVGQETGKTQNENLADLVNTVLKISKKRALVDCAAAICRRYGFNFAVDMEDVAANEAERNRVYGNNSGTHQQQKEDVPEAEIAISGATVQKIVDAMGSINIYWGTTKLRKWFADEVLKREIPPAEKLDDMTEKEGQAILKATLFLIQEKAKKVANEPKKEDPKEEQPPITSDTLADLEASFRCLNKTWEDARDKKYVETILKRPVPPAMTLNELTEPEAQILKKELEKLIRKPKS